MIGIDTNVLLRALLRDDARQSALAGQFFEKNLNQTNRGFINLAVLCETIWVLARGYGYKREQIAGAVEAILATEGFVVEDEKAVEAALALFRESAVDLADAIIANHNQNSGCGETVTFDRGASQTMRVLE